MLSTYFRVIWSLGWLLSVAYLPMVAAAQTPESTEPTPSKDTRVLISAAALGKVDLVRTLLAQGVDVPPLKLELHAYSDTPAERFVFINGRKYKEGERLADGPEVVRIEPNGVVLSQHGQRFQLAPE